MPKRDAANYRKESDWRLSAVKPKRRSVEKRNGGMKAVSASKENGKR
jgi:hypothetical protein